jgi:hypothetical protein
MRENCLKEFDAHWNCLEWNNQKYNLCRKDERPLNQCMFEKLVRARLLAAPALLADVMHDRA